MLKDRKICSQFSPIHIGTVENAISMNIPIVDLKFNHIQILYPSRLNAMAIDPSKIALDVGRKYTPGEIVFCIDLMLSVSLNFIPDSRRKTIVDHPRKSIIEHAVMIMREVFKFDHSIKIDVSGKEFPHVGLGSSGRLLAAVANGINEAFGSTIPKSILLKYIAQNHAEEISGNQKMLIPVQCIGGSAASGMFSGGFLVLAGENRVIFAHPIPEKWSFVIGYPEDFSFPDSSQLIEKEAQSFNLFMSIGKKYGKNIAYRILHEMIPSVIENDFDTVGNIIEWYRFKAGSLDACSYTHKRLQEIGMELVKLKLDGLASIVSVSSVGPGFFVMTRFPHECSKYFEGLGLNHFTAKPFNDMYSVRYINE